MKFEISTKLSYNAIVPSTLLLNVQPFKSLNQKIIQENFSSAPELEMRELNSLAGEKRFQIIDIPNPGNILLSYNAVVENNVKVVQAEYLDDVKISRMTASALSYLNPSRYCQSDKLYKFAYNKFGQIPHAFQKVMAIREWIHSNVEYSSGYTTPQTSAFDTITEQTGVCRDFAHLGIALCRALTIPARYCSAYACQLQPQDFHACFEVYLAGHWVIFDATKLAPLNGFVRIAVGRDAADTAIANIFGNISLDSMTVDSQLAEGVLIPFYYESGKFDGITYDAPETFSK
ncbi:MAG: transglutaminase family protein [Chitinophagaceae bacterium]|nr:MAG: transglutaminase family protein [Chitinophagaceae bacterium]